VVTASDLASALTPAFLDVIHHGADRPVLGIDIAADEQAVEVEVGDLVLAVGVGSIADLLRLIEHPPTPAGVVVRRSWAASAELRECCERVDVTLIGLAEGATWSVVMGLLGSVIDASSSRGGEQGGPSQAYRDLFDMADRISGILRAPVTIEDESSRVVAYSTGQDDVDEARAATIFGRRVPRRVRDHFRSMGVFRRLAQSDEPFLIPGVDEDLRGRYVIPIHVGGEVLGSIWAVTEDREPEDGARELRAATELIALYLLRLRAQGQLAHQVHLDQLRGLMRSGTYDNAGDLPEGPLRVAVLNGPVPDLRADSRRELWLVLTRRKGWRQPLVVDLDERVYAVLRADGADPGTWAWLRGLVESEGSARPAVGLLGGGVVDSPDALMDSRRQADELDELGAAELGRSVTTVEEAWPDLVLARAVTGLGARAPVSPLHGFLEQGHDPDGTVVETLEAVIDHWGEPRRAARQLGVHPNTVRYRLSRLAPLLPLDLEDPRQRLALRLEIETLRSARRQPS